MHNIEKHIDKVDFLVENRKYKVLNFEEFESLVSAINGTWGLKSFSRNKIKEFLFEKYFKRNKLVGDSSSEIYLISESKFDQYDIASTRSRKAYFSHYSALSINNLTIQLPKQIYLTLERPTLALTNHSAILQKSVDFTFNKPPRITSNKRVYKTFAINFINGQNQNHIGIVPFRNDYKVTDVERTLIDISVRPFYSGGVTQVLDAFINAKKFLDTEKLFEYYSKMNFGYPYHQVIGYYLQKAAYNKDSYIKFLSLPMELDFYLTYNILNKDYSEKWKLFIPKGL